MLDTYLERTLAAFLTGDRRAVARLITVVENGGPGAEAILEALYPRLQGAMRLGITGPPGVGKSTLVDALMRHHRATDRRVGVVAVDPTSPFTGGAVLGDRVRMNDLATDPNVFIRSMATRGSLGGLAQNTKEVVDVLEAFGHDILIIETVGVGQTEMDVAGTADTTVVVLSPESGDAIQAMKAGLMEAADVLVVNKSDRSGAAQMVRTLQADLSMRPSADWTPPVLQTIAAKGEGVAELAAAVADHQAYLTRSGDLAARRERRVSDDITAVLRDRLWRRVEHTLADQLPAWTARVGSGEATPYTAARELLAAFLEDEQ